MDFPHVYLLTLTILGVYMAAISLMTTQVSYPLYAAVPRAAFVDYHERYNRRIAPVIVAPGLPTFLACAAFAFLRPGTVPPWLGLLVAAGGLAALLAEANGVENEPHIKDALATLVIHSTMCKAAGEAAMANGQQNEDGIVTPSPLYISALKYYKNEFHAKLLDILHDIAGTLTVNAPTFADFEHRNIKRPAAEVVNCDGLILLLIETVRQRRRRRLVDDALHIQPGNLARIFRGLPLGVIEVRGNSDHRVVYLLAQVVFRRLLQLLQNHGGNLRRRMLLALRQHGNMVA